jgi:hypothetical protein
MSEITTYAVPGHSWLAKAEKNPPKFPFGLGYNETLLGYKEHNPQVTQFQDFKLPIPELHLSHRESICKRGNAGVHAGAATRVDLRQFTSPVKNQGSCGSCVAFGVLAAVECTARFLQNARQLPIDLSEGELFNCVARKLGTNCSWGWILAPAFAHLANPGVLHEECSPYSPEDVPCKKLCADDAPRLRVREVRSFSNVVEMKAWLEDRGALTTIFTVYSDLARYHSGIYTRTAEATVVGGHCVAVVGYDDIEGCWICQNSWGAGWGEQGFFRIKYGECGIDALMYGAIPEHWEPPPPPAPPPEPVPPPRPVTIPVYQFTNNETRTHYYSLSRDDYPFGYVFSGIICRVRPLDPPAVAPPCNCP